MLQYATIVTIDRINGTFLLIDNNVAICYIYREKGGKVMASTSPLRLDSALMTAAERAGSIYKRTAPKQIEYWAELGKAVERVVRIEDIIAIIEGVKKIVVEPVTSTSVDPNDVFNSLETSRKSGDLAKEVTSSAVYYESSLSQPGLIDKVDSTTGKRQTGHFHNGEFVVQV